MKKLLTSLLLLLACMAIFCACSEGSTEPPAVQTPNGGEASGGDQTPPHTHTWSGNAVCTSCGYESKLEYTEYDSYVKVTGIGTASGDVQVSNVYNGKPVTIIGDYAFADCTGLASITIPSSIMSIGEGAFEECESLTSITIPSSITSIGDYAFCYCTGLTSITIPSSVTSIGVGVFEDCERLTGITIPSSVTSIGEEAFGDCTGLASITIPSSVTRIDSEAFLGCSSLARITVENGNTVYHSEGNCLIETASRTLLTGCKNSVIPTNGSVTSIESSAFSGCTGLTSIVIPSSVTSIGWCAFYDCTGLTSVTFANTEGWWRSTSSTATSGTSVDVSNPGDNADLLTDTYRFYYWKRG
ncbi:MAG: leucine-rich repeat domain-containing protein [Clostridia bacterium]|nr:leucine-rich repeat domain-containing protein [Clostridia bacterium]